MLIRDLQIPLRRLQHSPGFTALAAFTLALAIASDTTVFSIAQAVLLRPLPYRDPARLISLWEDHSRQGGDSRLSVAPATFDDYRRQSHAFTGLVALRSHAFNLVEGDEPEVVFGSEVSADFFPLLGREPLLGRAFTAADVRTDAEPTVILSHALWKRRFAGERRVLGQSLRINDKRYTVIGIMPPDFSVPLHFKSPAQGNDLWVPQLPRPELDNHAVHLLQVIGRLAPGVTLAQARADVGTIARRLAADFPKDCAGVGATLVPFQEQIVGPVRTSILALLGAVTFLLLIACTNVASLLLARALARGRETSLCAALGASRAQLVGQLLGESLLLVALGGLGGILLAQAAIRLLPALLPADIPRAETIRLDAAVLVYTLGLSALAGLGIGLGAALRASRANLQEALKEGGKGGSAGGGRSRLTAALVMAQIALALLLVLASGLMVQSFVRLQGVDPGFRPANVLTFSVGLPPRKYSREEQQVAFFADLARRLQSLPGVVSAAGITRLPLDPGFGIGTLTLQGKPTPPSGPPEIGVRALTPAYFQTMGIPLVEGRQLSDRDDAHAPAVALVNRSLARRYWPQEKSFGQRVRFDPEGPWVEVVGVVGDVVHDSLASEPQPEAYLPLPQSPSSGLQMVVRTTAEPLALAAAVRREVHALDRDQPVNGLGTMEQHVAAALARPRFLLVLVASFAVLALVLAAVGVFSLNGYTVVERTKEIGIRMALGASAEDALRLILGRTARLALAGVAFGIVAGYLLTRWLAGQLYQVGSLEPIPFLGGAAFLVAVALVAGYIPARRAARVDPMVALRHE
ncbi:MAG TPA: ABC transporter permease [Thermoanaerobaculia bacterium]|nr:ABC transporter permease [Thermoanaerobaculia bacterium]